MTGRDVEIWEFLINKLHVLLSYAPTCAALATQVLAPRIGCIDMQGAKE